MTKITKRFVSEIKYAGKIKTYFDEDFKGFGVRVFKTEKSFVFR